MANKKHQDEARDTYDLCWDFVAELETASPRGTAIVAAAVLDEILARLLEKVMVEDPEVAKQVVREVYTLANFRARIEGAKRFDLISEGQYRVLDIIRQVRNSFAHHVNWSFDEPTTAEKCLTLDLSTLTVYEPGKEADPEHRFIQNAVALCGQLDGMLRNWIKVGFDPRDDNRPWRRRPYGPDKEKG